MIHGKDSSYNHGCRCPDCTRAHALASGSTPCECAYRDWIVLNLPIAVVMRQAFSDAEAIEVAAAMP